MLQGTGGVVVRTIGKRSIYTLLDDGFKLEYGKESTVATGE